jgi:hypothetical protein
MPLATSVAWYSSSLMPCSQARSAAAAAAMAVFKQQQQQQHQ